MSLGDLFTLQGTLFAMILVGMFLRKRGIIDESGKKCLTDLCVNVIIPCSIVKSCLVAFDPGLIRTGGLLLAGPPGSGKTTLLRSLAQKLCEGDALVSVIDERGELMACEAGSLPRAAQIRCDVYARCTKAEGIAMALRCMNPQVIVCDELGTQADLQAVEAGLACGVVFVASVHCDTLEALNRKPPTARLLAMGAFETLVLLDGRVNPGHAVKVRTLA